MDVPPSVLDLFQYWYANQQLKWLPEDEPPTVKDLLHLWLLAERLEVPSLQNAIIYFLNVHPKKMAQLTTVDYTEIWETKMKKDGLLAKFVVDTLGRRMDTIEHLEYFPKEMLAEMFLSARKELQRMNRQEAQRGGTKGARWSRFNQKGLPKYIIKGVEAASGEALSAISQTQKD
jgi:hypothetical protein